MNQTPTNSAADDSFAELRKAVIDQKKASLPAEVDDPRLADLHQAVTTYDQLVSQVVIGVLQQLDISIAPSAIDDSCTQIARLLSSTEISANPKVNIYRTYTARLDRMLELARNVQSQQTKR